MSFQFKQFSIEDEHCAMKIGTDGCLLGAWADVKNTETILDIGTGCGLIALMLAQRCNAVIDAVDIDQGAYSQACENFMKSPWSYRLHAFHSSVQEYTKTCKKKYDLIVSCPPYFHNSMKTTNRKRLLARHTDSLSFEDLITCSLRLLKPEGKFCVIIPSHINNLFSNITLTEGYHITRATLIETIAGIEPIRVLMQLERARKKRIDSAVAVLDKSGKEYTEEYKKLTKDFYLNF